jgi:hypothetical protein
MQAQRVRAVRAAYAGVLAGGFAAVLAVNLPGHLTVDSVLELYEGRFRIRQSWAPSFYAWVLGVFDHVWPGAGLYIVASALLLFLALASFAWLRGRTRGWAVLAAALFAASPLVLIYQGIVWKDVLFANAAIAGFVCLAWASTRRERRGARWSLLAAALLLLAAAALLRQNGVVAGVLAAAAFGWNQARGRWPRGLAWGLGALVAVIAVSHAMNLATQPEGPGSGDGMAEGVRVLQRYDVLGAIALDPAYPLDALAASEPQATAVLRRLVPRYYSAERTDFTDGQDQIQGALDAIPDDALQAEWRRLILRHPWLYLRERAAVFRWVFLTPKVNRCVPVALGVQGPADALEELGMSVRWSDADDALLAYDKAFTHTPVYSHLVYALLALAVGLALLRRRDPADVAMIALMAAALLFAASFFVISIACDYRYLYFLDLSAMAGVLYVAVDPPGRARPAKR